MLPFARSIPWRVCYVMWILLIPRCIIIRYSYTHVPEIENRSSNSLFAFGGFNLSRTKMLSDYCQLFVLFSFLNTFLLIIYLICCTYVKPSKLLCVGEISTSWKRSKLSSSVISLSEWTKQNFILNMENMKGGLD